MGDSGVNAPLAEASSTVEPIVSETDTRTTSYHLDSRAGTIASSAATPLPPPLPLSPPPPPPSMASTPSTAAAPSSSAAPSAQTSAVSSPAASPRYPARPTNLLTKSLTTAAATSTASSSVNIRGSAFANQITAPARSSSLRPPPSQTHQQPQPQPQHEEWETASQGSAQSPPTRDQSTLEDGASRGRRGFAGLFATSSKGLSTEAEHDRVDSLSSLHAFPIGHKDGVNEFGQKVSAGGARDALGYIRSVSDRAEVKAPASLRSRPVSFVEKASASSSRAPSPMPTARTSSSAVLSIESSGELSAGKGTSHASREEADKAPGIVAEEETRASQPTIVGPMSPETENDERYPDRKYYILSSAGKPIYISHLASQRESRSRRGSADAIDQEAARKRQRELEDEADEMATTQVGVMQALISIFADEDGDKLRYINADSGRTRITFLLRSPLYLVCVSSWGEPPATTRLHLENLYLQVLSLVSAGQLSRLFSRMPNFDLRRLLEGTDVLLGSMLSRLQTDMCFSLEALQPVRIEAPLREAVSTLLLPPKGDARPKDLLYVLLLANQRILTLLRPRRHSVHPADMHLLVNTVYGTESIREPGGESWIPICLPKFAPQGFVHAYVSFFERPPSNEGDAAASPDGRTGEDDTLALVIVTGNRDGFSDLSAWRNEVANALLAPSKAFRPTLLHGLFDAIRRSDYSADELGIPGLRHFIYKSRTNVQITASRLEPPYENGNEDHKRLVTLYTLAHDAIHGLSTGASVPLPGGTRTSTDLAVEHLGRGSSSSSFASSAFGGRRPAPTAAGGAAKLHSKLPPIAGPVKMQYYQTDREAVLAWITQPFELYMTFNPWLGKTAIVMAANGVAKWTRANEAQVFITSGLTF